MERLDGFIDISKILGIPNEDYLSTPNNYNKLCRLLVNIPSVEIIKSSPGVKLIFSFLFNNEVYYFKYDSVVDPYNELITEEICKKLGVDCVSYDLAVIGGMRGVISKDFKKAKVKYISGKEILDEYLKKYYSPEEMNMPYFLPTNNSLETIWYALEDRYHDAAIVQKLMVQVVNMYIVDTLTCQSDRHYKNWMIAEERDDVNLQPMFDNSRIYMNHPGLSRVSMYVENNLTYLPFYNPFLEENIVDFLEHSSKEFVEAFRKSLKVLKEDSIRDVIKKIEEKTGVVMPKKDTLLEKVKIHREYLEELLEESVKR